MTSDEIRELEQNSFEWTREYIRCGLFVRLEQWEGNIHAYPVDTQ